jgi:UDP-N-acetyl-D-galactosamine dehydrogenase
MANDGTVLGVIGLGYVGLPLAVEFGKVLPTIGFDINANRIAELKGGHDRTLELDAAEIASATHITFCSDLAALQRCNTYIVTVPTPIDRFLRPDLTPLEQASATIGKVISSGDTVIFESTVYPGCTEEVCIPIIERISGLRYKHGFHAGYSPERINPGDKAHRLPSIVKVTSGSSPAAADFVDALYRRIVTAGTHKASSIMVAEAAKVIENTQRDLNIALVNELALIFNRLGIDTLEVLEAAGTKWNFLPFRPGLVGGHCIGVDPYYLTHKAQAVGYHPEVILSGRRVNDNMAGWISGRVLHLMAERRINVVASRALIMGLTFMENCPDLRNTKVIDIVRQLQRYNVAVDVHDPWVDAEECEHEYGIRPIAVPQPSSYDAIVVCVAHRQFVEMGLAAIRALGKSEHVIFDVKSMFPRELVDERL